MKKLLALLMVIVLCFSLCACGGESNTSETTAPTEATMTKEEMLAQAQEVTLAEILAEIENNEVRAEELYEGKIVKIENFKVESISSSTDDSATIEWIYWGSANSVLTVKAHIPKKDAAMLSTGDLVTVVGEFEINMGVYAYINDAFIVNE